MNKVSSPDANPIKRLIVIDKSSEVPIYLQIMNAMILNIRQGRLRPGSKLPGSREFADLLNVHRKTMLAAFEELLAQGWIEMIPRKGTFVVKNLPEIKPKKIKDDETILRYAAKTNFAFRNKEILSFPVPNQLSNPLVINDGFPDIRLAPTEVLFRELRRIGKQRSFRKYFHYSDPAGSNMLVETLAAFLNETRGLPIASQNVMVTGGAQLAFYLAATLLIKPGDHVIVGEPGYFAATITFQEVGGLVHHAPVDDFGIDVDAIETFCKKRKVSVVYVIPHHHHPTTVTLIPERRVRLLELAAKYKFAIIEDDYDYDFHYSGAPVLPIASLDQSGNVIYIGTLSKTLAPALRAGFMVAPANFIRAAAYRRRWIDRQGNTLMEIALAELYKNGTMASHIRKVVKVYHERRDHFCQLVADKLAKYIAFKMPEGGMSIWATFLQSSVKDISRKAASKGLTMSDGTIYNLHKDYNATRLGFASLNFNEQEKALDILEKCFR